MVRRYKDLIEEIKDKQRFTREDWTRKVIEALEYTMEQLRTNQLPVDKTERITYEEWRGWQESLAKRYGFSETTDQPPDYRKRTKSWMKVRP